jgi:hypothetical protein
MNTPLVIGREDYTLWKPKKKETIVCQCGEILQPINLEKHEKSQHHIKFLNFMKGLNENIITCQRISKTKKIVYENSKNEANCCCRCFNSYIIDELFNKKYKVCRCCEDILKGGTKKCATCKEVVNMIDLERPYLIRCKKCAKNIKKEKSKKI